MIDSAGFRANVGMILVNAKKQVLWARRVGGQQAWQFPQGGVNEGETPQEAMYRELKEELGVSPQDVKIIAETQEWLYYRLPKRFQRHDDGQRCIGQKQKWFLLELIGGDEAIQLNHSAHPEFDAWRWVNYWFPLKQVIFFKRAVYRKALHTFLQYVKNGKQENRE